MPGIIHVQWYQEQYGRAGMHLLEVLAKYRRGPTLRYQKLLKMYFVVESYAAGNRPKLDKPVSP